MPIVGNDPMTRLICALAEKADVESWLQLLAEIRLLPMKVTK